MCIINYRFFLGGKNGTSFFVYFTGHGNSRGNWIVNSTDSPSYNVRYITLRQVLQYWCEQDHSDSNLNLIVDCCYSGTWVKSLRRHHQRGEHQNVQMIASCRGKETCKYSRKHGSDFTRAFCMKNYHYRQAYTCTKLFKVQWTFRAVLKR